MANKVFFLGAGFSKALCSKFPLMNELTNDVVSRLDKDSVRRHFDELTIPVRKNFEILLTYLGTNWPWKNDTTRHANLALYSAIIQNLSNIFNELTTQYIYGEQYEIDETFFAFAKKAIIPKNKMNFITLNYDVLLELLLRRSSNWELTYNDFYKYPMSLLSTRILDSNSITIRTPQSQAPSILKLHGSSNWFWAGETTADEIYFSEGQEKDYDNVVMGLKPYIIPPVLDKNDFYNHIAIRALWQKAEQLLKKADEIYIVGFSFPQTDLSVRYLFQSSLRNSNPNIYVVNRARKKDLLLAYNDVLNERGIDYTYTDGNDVVKQFIREHFLENKDENN